jgi:hypothetical protein
MKEIDNQPRANSSKENVLKRKNEKTISPPSKMAKHILEDTPHQSSGSSSADQATPPPSAAVVRPKPISTLTSFHKATSSTAVLSELNHPSSPLLWAPPANLVSVKNYNEQTSHRKHEKMIKAPSPAPHQLANFGCLKWPHEFFVIDIVEGLVEYESRIQQDQTQSEAFLTVFGVPCIRETLRHKITFLAQIRKNNMQFLSKFMALGRVHAARWAYFESLVTGTCIHGKTRLEQLEKYPISDDSDSDRCVVYSMVICYLTLAFYTAP